jgi:hypothetical protein
MLIEEDQIQRQSEGKYTKYIRKNGGRGAEMFIV